MTNSEYLALVANVGYIRFLRDLPHLKAGFAALGKEGWQNLVTGKKPKDSRLAEQAWPIYIDEYDLGREQGEIPRLAAREYMQAIKDKRLPSWVGNMALTGEIRRAAGKGGQ